MLTVALSVPLAVVGAPDNESTLESAVDPERPFLVTIALKGKRRADTDAEELADSVGGKVIHRNSAAAIYRLRLPTNSLKELGATLDKLEADPRVLRMKWEIY